MRKTLLLLLLAYTLGLASQPAYQVVINDAPSKVQLLQDKDSLSLPLVFPVPEQVEEWTVSLSRDEKSRQVAVKMNRVKRKLRGEVDCYWCNATGLCAQDYPAGSGNNYSGVCESNCNGTGKCSHCGGTGKL